MYSILLATSAIALAADAGSFRFSPAADESSLPACYRLEARDVTYQSALKYELPHCGVNVYHITFPSPFESPHKENNTVHAEYYQSKSPGKCASAVILDITAGDQSLSRGIALFLAQNKINTLFVQMAYYGPRRPPGSRIRMLSMDIPRTLAAVRQTILDVRVAGAWLATRPENDPDRVGILGTSLGSFVAAVCAETDVRFNRVALLLGGGGLVDAFYDHPQAKPYVRIYESLGGSKDKVKAMIAPADPLTLAERLKGRRVIMLNASRDEIVPPTCSKEFWEAAGRPKVVWFDTTHYGAALFIPKMLRIVVEHLGKP